MNAHALSFEPNANTQANVLVAESVGKQAAALAAHQNRLAISGMHLQALFSTFDMIERLVPFSQPELVGSLAVGLWTSSSDIDVVLSVSELVPVPASYRSMPLTEILAGEDAVLQAREARKQVQPRAAKKEVEFDVFSKAISARLSSFGFDLAQYGRFLTRLCHTASGTQVDLWYDSYKAASADQKKSKHDKTKGKGASLFVGDLAPNMVERDLFPIFLAFGPVASIRVCRHHSTRESLGHAYVNYHNVESSVQAAAHVNGTVIAGMPCRVMQSQRDSATRLQSKLLPRRALVVKDLVSGNPALRAIYTICRLCRLQLGRKASDPRPTGSLHGSMRAMDGYNSGFSGYVLLALIARAGLLDVPDTLTSNCREDDPHFHFHLGYSLLCLLDSFGNLHRQSNGLICYGCECRIADLVEGLPAIRIEWELIQHAAESVKLLAMRLRQGIGLCQALELDEHDTSLAADDIKDTQELRQAQCEAFAGLKQLYS